MKIIGGKFKNRNFFMPKGIRPTQDRTRKALFDILGQDLSGVMFIDIFAGSGAVGLEAISRNAKYVYFVEKNLRCAQVIDENLRHFGITFSGLRSAEAFVATTDAFTALKYLHRQGKTFDIAFIDPPYGRDLAKKALKTISAYDILQPNCYIVLQHSKREKLPEHQGRFVLLKQKKYGSSHLSVYEGEATTISE